MAHLGQPDSNSFPTVREAIQIAIICALEEERDAVWETMRKDWKANLGKAKSDPNQYRYGWLGSKPVVLVLLTKMGPQESGYTAKDIAASFENISLALVVGIAGGAPFKFDPKKAPAKETGSDSDKTLKKLAGLDSGDNEFQEKASMLSRNNVKLGDVLISTRVIEWDEGKMSEKGLSLNYDGPGLRLPPREIQNLMRDIESASYLKHILLPKVRSDFWDTNPDANEAFVKRPSSKDRLYASTYRHKHRSSSEFTSLDCECVRCNEIWHDPCNKALRSSCDELACEPVQVNEHSDKDENIHFGVIASGKHVIKGAHIRNKIIWEIFKAKKESVIGFEMEGLGVWDILHTIVVKGVVDYADSHKNKEWREYPAARAALCAAEIVTRYQLPDLPRGVMNSYYQSRLSRIEAVVETLFLTDPEQDRTDLEEERGQKVDGSCEWITNLPTYSSWQKLENSEPVLVLSGKEGTGKTMLAIFLTHELERKSTQATIYYFCDFRHWERNSAVAILRGLLWQIVKRRPEIAGRLLDFFSGNEKEDKRRRESRIILWSAFSEILLDPNLGPTFCVLDGIDECDSNSREWLKTKLTGDFAREVQKNNRSVRLIITCAQGLIPSAPLQIDIEPKIGKDIAKLIIHGTQELIGRLPPMDDLSRTKLANEVEQVLYERAEGTFLWVGYAFSELQGVKTATEARKSLGRLPTGLTKIYQRMIFETRLEKRERDTILAWIGTAVQPLSFPALAAALSNSEFQLELDHIAMCGPILKVTEHNVAFVHKSARQFLFGEEINQEPVLSGPIHDEVALTCLLYIDRSKVMRAGMKIKSFLEEAESESEEPFLRYAVMNWPEHMRSSSEKSQEQLLDRFSKFFDFKDSPLSEWWRIYTFSNGYVEHEKISPIHIASFLGIATWVKRILSNCLYRWYLIKETDGGGQTALHHAAGAGHRELVKLLLQKGANKKVLDHYGFSPRRLAEEAGHEAVAILVDDPEWNESEEERLSGWKV